MDSQYTKLTATEDSDIGLAPIEDTLWVDHIAGRVPCEVQWQARLE